MVVNRDRWRIWAALATIYVVWGSTYLAIKITVRTQPPLYSGGARFITPGLRCGRSPVSFSTSAAISAR